LVDRRLSSRLGWLDLAYPKIINPEAKFVFRDVPAAQSEAVPYDENG
jgi:hypothetical protein